MIAFLLEHFFDVLQRQLDSYKLAKPKVVTLTSVCHHISAHLGYIRHWKSIYDYVRLRRTQPRVNPIQVGFYNVSLQTKLNKVLQSNCTQQENKTICKEFQNFIRYFGIFSFIFSIKKRRPFVIDTNDSTRTLSLNQPSNLPQSYQSNSPNTLKRFVNTLFVFFSLKSFKIDVKK